MARVLLEEESQVNPRGITAGMCQRKLRASEVLEPSPEKAARWGRYSFLSGEEEHSLTRSQRDLFGSAGRALPAVIRHTDGGLTPAPDVPAPAAVGNWMRP